jgi:tRNA-Thr(GGU) m(6)t(6)A37 methyltransferase TsaA
VTGEIVYRPIGCIRSPCTERAPSQPHEDDDSGEFVLELLPEYVPALRDLECFRYVYVIFHMDRARGYDGTGLAHPPSLKGGTVGLFASRSPNRPNAIGIDVARILRIEGARIFTTGLSALDGTPLLDLKPYFGSDARPDAGDGWKDR